MNDEAVESDGVSEGNEGWGDCRGWLPEVLMKVKLGELRSTAQMRGGDGRIGHTF